MVTVSLSVFIFPKSMMPIVAELGIKITCILEDHKRFDQSKHLLVQHKFR